MRMEVDASDYTTEGILSMEYKDERLRPVVFLSKWDQEKLQNSWQRNVGSYKRARKLEVFIKRYKI